MRDVRVRRGPTVGRRLRGLVTQVLSSPAGLTATLLACKDQEPVFTLGPVHRKGTKVKRVDFLHEPRGSSLSRHSCGSGVRLLLHGDGGTPRDPALPCRRESGLSEDSDPQGQGGVYTESVVTEDWDPLENLSRDKICPKSKHLFTVSTTVLEVRRGGRGVRQRDCTHTMQAVYLPWS